MEISSNNLTSSSSGHAEEFVVALFDVLGFEDQLTRFSLDEIHGQYKELISIASSKNSHAFFDARPVGDGTSVPFFGYVEIEQDYFSDTILLWTRFHSGTFYPFLQMCSHLVCEALRAELPLRGAISLGDAIMDKSTRTYIGSPLAEAARAEKAQRWIGLSFGRSFTTRKDVPFRADIARPYKNHLKPGFTDVAAELVVDWPRTWREENQASAVSILERLSTCGKASEYYQSTIEFVKYSDSSPEWWTSYQANP